MGRLPLEGVKVADFCWVWTGPTTTKVLADFGATVLKIESYKRLETWRIQPPFKDDDPGPNRGAIFNSINTSKHSVTINLSQPKGIELAKKLVAWADVVTENYAGGSMARMGLGYEVLRQIKPDIIMLSSALMGQTGPWHNSPGYGDQLTAISGISEIAGWPDRIPAEVGYYTDYVAPRFNALTILAALDYKRRTGKGLYLDIAQHQSSIQFVAPVVLDYVVNKRVAKRQGNRDDSAAPHGIYPCSGNDRWCAIAVSSDEEWQKFCQAIDRLAWAADSRFATFQDRKEHENELDALVASWTVNQIDQDIMNLLQAAGISVGIVTNAEDQMEHDPQLKYRNFHVELEHPEIGKYRAPRQPCVLSKTPCEIKRAPLIGEHTEATLREILGMSDEEITQLAIEGVLE